MTALSWYAAWWEILYLIQGPQAVGQYMYQSLQALMDFINAPKIRWMAIRPKKVSSVATSISSLLLSCFNVLMFPVFLHIFLRH